MYLHCLQADWRLPGSSRHGDACSDCRWLAEGGGGEEAAGQVRQGCVELREVNGW